MISVQPLAQIVLKAARANGIINPILFDVEANSVQGQDILRELEENSVPSVVIESGKEYTLVVVATPDACQLLNKQGSSGGKYIAEMLENLRRADFHIVCVGVDSIGIRWIANGVIMNGHTTGYAEATPCDWYDLYIDPTVSMCPVATPWGIKIPVCGRTGREAGVAAGIVEAVLRGKAELPCGGRLVNLPLTKDAMVKVLDMVQHSPWAIAEAIMALRKIQGNFDKRITNVLWGTPKFRTLARKVEKELTGI